MRSLLFFLPYAALAGCAATAPQVDVPTAAPAAFTIPMDPGQIRCSQLSTPPALSAATDWTLGRARAAVLSGRLSAAPDAITLAGDLERFCQQNSAATLSGAATQLGY